jgi:2-haloalkanoic acid dehalogenase type II
MNTPDHPPAAWPRAVLFDLLTALLDSWSLWNAAAGSETAGRGWRAEYLRLTYGCGAYQPYEELVRAAARNQGLPASVADRLEDRWDQLQPWDGARALLEALRPHCRLAVVTNCSEHLGRKAAALLGVDWDVVVTSEAAGFYKPDPRPYRLALERLDLPACDAAFVAGSGYDLFGTSAVGLRTFWHNRVGLVPPQGAPAAECEAATLGPARAWLSGFAASSS